MRALAIVLGALALMFATAWIMRHEPSVARRGEVRVSSAAPQPPELRELRELAQLRAEVRELRGEVADARASAPASAGEITENSEPTSAAPAPLDPEHAAAERAEALSIRFDAEPRDEAWSVEAAGNIRAVFAGGAVSGTQLDTAECRSTLCRVTLRHDDEAARVELAEHIAGQEAFASGVYYRYSPDDVRETTLYVVRGRQGHPG
jgi:hypothetical protein